MIAVLLSGMLGFVGAVLTLGGLLADDLFVVIIGVALVVIWAELRAARGRAVRR